MARKHPTREATMILIIIFAILFVLTGYVVLCRWTPYPNDKEQS